MFYLATTHNDTDQYYVGPVTARTFHIMGILHNFYIVEGIMFSDNTCHAMEYRTMEDALKAQKILSSYVPRDVTVVEVL